MPIIPLKEEVIAIAASEFGRPPHFIYREVIHPAVLNDDDTKLVMDVSLSCLQALGLGWGPTNVELRWTKRGPVVIEVNPRLTGGANPRLVQAAYGVDLITEHIKLVIGEKYDLRKKHSQIAGARFLIADRCGTLDVNGASRASAVPGVSEVQLYLEANKSIFIKGDSRDRIGHVIAVSPTLARTRAILDRAVNLIDWSITPITSLGEQGCSPSR